MSHLGRVVAEREYGSPTPTDDTDRPVTDRVHAAVKRNKTAGRDAQLDLARRQADRAQLTLRHDASLPRRETCDDSIWGGLTTHTVVKAPRVGFRPPRVRSRARAGGSA